MGKMRHLKNRTKSKKNIDVTSNEIEEEQMDDVIDGNCDDDFDKRSVISNKTIKSLVSKKKDKIMLKRRLLLKRLHAAHELKRETNERAARRRTVIVSDMKDEFENSLGQIETYLEEQRLAMSKKNKTRKQILPQAARNRESQANIDIFNMISQSTEYSTNPFEFIKKQLEQQIASPVREKK